MLKVFVLLVPVALLATFALHSVAQPASPGTAPIAATLDDATRRTLNNLYAVVPTARDDVRASVGHAVFDPGAPGNPAPDGSVRGVLIETATGRVTPMTIVRPTSGPFRSPPGMRQVVLLKSRAVFERLRDKGIDTLPTGESAASRSAMDARQPDIAVFELMPHGVMMRMTWGPVRYIPGARP